MAISEGRCALTWRNELWKTGRWIVITYRALHKKYLNPSTFNHLTDVHIRLVNTEIIYIEYHILFSWLDHVTFQSESLILMYVRPKSDRVHILSMSKYNVYKRIYTERYSNLFLVQQTIGSPLLTIHVRPSNHQFKTSVITNDFNFIFNFHMRNEFKLRKPIIVPFKIFLWVVKMLGRRDIYKILHVRSQFRA
jgi:hypothetical protein